MADRFPIPHRRRGFTLLEMMMAVMILMLFATAAVNLVKSQATAARYYSEARLTYDEVESFFDLLQHEFMTIHEGPPGAYLGEASELQGAASDTMEFRLRSGPLLGYDNGREERAVKLLVEEIDGNKVLTRESWNPEQIGDSDQRKSILSKEINWFEVRYFDPRVNSWVENWVDRNQPPTLIRMRVKTNANDLEYMRVFQLPPMPYQRQA